MGRAHSGMAREWAFCRGVRDEPGVQGVDALLGGVSTTACRQVAGSDDAEFGGNTFPSTPETADAAIKQDTAVLARAQSDCGDGSSGDGRRDWCRTDPCAARVRRVAAR